MIIVLVLWLINHQYPKYELFLRPSQCSVCFCSCAQAPHSVCVMPAVCNYGQIMGETDCMKQSLMGLSTQLPSSPPTISQVQTLHTNSCTSLNKQPCEYTRSHTNGSRWKRDARLMWHLFASFLSKPKANRSGVSFHRWQTHFEHSETRCWSLTTFMLSSFWLVEL